MTDASANGRMAGKAAWAAMLAVFLLLTCLMGVGARPLGSFSDLTPNDVDDTMPAMKVDTSDAAHIVYQSHDGTGSDIYYQTNASGSWSTTRITNDSLDDIHPELQLDSDNNPHVTWAHWDGSDYEILYATNASGSWVTSAVTGNDVDDNHPSLALEKPPTLNAVSAFDADTAWAVGDEGLILKTTDGGSVWTVQEWGAYDAADLNGVAAAGTDRAWAVGDGGLIVSTTNGGADWTVQESRTVSDLYDVTADDAYTAWAVGADGTIRSTTDGGAVWNSQPSTTRNDLYAVTGTGAGGLWAAGSKGVILHTANGGARWAGQSSPTIADLTGISAADANTAWAVGTGGVILFTGDAGAGWSAQDSGMIDDFTEVSASGPRHAWAVGSSGSVYITEDGGFTWDEQATGYATRLFGIDSTDAGHTWAVGSNAIILKAADQGRNWSKQDSGFIGNAWISFESHDPIGQHPVIQTCSNAEGAWAFLHQVESEAGARSPSLTISESGETGHLALVVQDGGCWKVFYQTFDALTGATGYGIYVSSEGRNQLSPSILLIDDTPVIAFQGLNGEGDEANYDIYLSRLTVDFSTSRLTATRDSELKPVLSINPHSEEYCIGYQGCTPGMDFYPGLVRYNPLDGSVMNDAYTDMTSRVASRAVAVYANDAYNIHFCCAAQDPDLDVYYGYLSTNPWIYGVDAVESGAPASGPSTPPAWTGQTYRVSGTDLGTNGTIYIHVLVETSPGQWEDREIQASVVNWTPTAIILSGLMGNGADLRPVDGSVRVRAFGRDSNSDVLLHLPEPTVAD